MDSSKEKIRSAVAALVLLFGLAVVGGTSSCGKSEAPPEPVGTTPKADREDELTDDCQSRVKQIALATVMYSGDYDDKFPTGHDMNVLDPYMKRANEKTCPKTGHEYAFNPLLLASSVVEMESPAEIVMWYEGASQKLEFPHKGLSVVAYGDTHTGKLDKNKKLNWKPDGSDR